LCGSHHFAFAPLSFEMLETGIFSGFNTLSLKELCLFFEKFGQTKTPRKPHPQTENPSENHPAFWSPDCGFTGVSVATPSTPPGPTPSCFSDDFG
jgi:hypothetical protein